MSSPSEPTTGLLLLRNADREIQVQVTWPTATACESHAAVVVGPPDAVARVSTLLGSAGLLILGIEGSPPDLREVTEVMSWYAAHAPDLDVPPARTIALVALADVPAQDKDPRSAR